MSELEVVTFRRGPFWNFSYLVACPRTARAAVIDPAWDVPGILAVVRQRGLAVDSVWLTHGHTDHVNGVAELAEATGARVFVHEAEAAGLAGQFAVEAIHGTATIRVGEIQVELLHTPGHSPGSMSVVADGCVFTGDTLLVGGVGRPEPGGVEALWGSVRALREMHPATLVYPGHDEGRSPTSTLGAELEGVAALRAGTFEGFVRALERTTGRSHRETGEGEQSW